MSYTFTTVAQQRSGNPLTDSCWGSNLHVVKEQLMKGEAVLYLQGGISPISYSTDTVFEKKYGVKYSDLGCVREAPMGCYILYNQTVFSYLDKKFGVTWRKKVRKDVFGIKG